MNIGILYNAFVCTVIGLTGLSIFYSLRIRRKEGSSYHHKSLESFSFLLGLIWLAIGVRALFTFTGLGTWDLLIYNWLIGPLTYLHIVPAFYYLSWSFFRERKIYRIMINALFTMVALGAVWAFYRYGFGEPEITYWGNNRVPNDIANNIFIFGLFVPGFLGILAEVVRRLKKWRQIKSFKQKQLLGFSLGFLAYAVTGIFEAVIFTEGWLILLARISVMIAPLIFYFVATLEKNQ